MAIEYVKNEDGSIKVGENGNPMVRDGDQEYELDAIHLSSKIPELQKEAKNHRLKAKELQEQLEKYQGIDDPEKAREALQTVQHLEDEKLIDAGKAEEMKRQIREQYESKMAEKDQELSKRDQQIHQLVISNAFANSRVINEQTVLPHDVAEAYFGKHFKVENGQAIAYDSAGNVIYSKERPGEPANFDEALQTIINQYPQKDRILKATPGGSGAVPGDKAAKGRTISRSQFEQLAPQERMSFVKSGGQISE
jgi:hypothetical protein